jgi:hypothetical protein
MAERLKTKMLEGNLVDLVAGPDAYRDLPRLLDIVHAGNQEEAGKSCNYTLHLYCSVHIVVHIIQQRLLLFACCRSCLS